MTPDHINPLQWHEAMGVARQSCARVFRDGGSPGDALAAFGLGGKSLVERENNWDRVVSLIAEVLCAKPVRRAA